MRSLLLCRSGDDAGLAQRIAAGRCVLGRARECDFPLLQDQLSRKHAEVIEDDGAICLRDLDSSNGTSLNGRRLEPGVKELLNHFDVITLGEAVELVYLELDRIPITEIIAAALVGPEGSRVPLRVGTNTIGSAEDADLIVDDAAVAPLHAKLILSARGLVVEREPQALHLSVNGTVTDLSVLADGDVLQLTPSAEFTIAIVTGLGTPERAAGTDTFVMHRVAAGAPPSDDPPTRPIPARPTPMPAGAVPTAAVPAEAPPAERPPAERVAVVQAPEASQAAQADESTAATVQVKSLAAGDGEATASVREQTTAPAPESSPAPALEKNATGEQWPAQLEAPRSFGEHTHPNLAAPGAPIERLPDLPGDVTATTTVERGDIAASLQRARERHAAQVAQRSNEDTNSRRSGKAVQPDPALGASVRRPALQAPDFSAVRREAAVRIHVALPSGDVRVTLLREGRHILGRAETCRVCVTHPSISREHAELNVGPQGVKIRDLGSANGILREGRRVTEAMVPSGERVRFGEVTAWFEDL